MDEVSEGQTESRCRDAIASARDSAGVELDFSTGSVARVDTVLDEIGRRLSGLSPEQRQKAAYGVSLSYGTYLGEVVTRAVNGCVFQCFPRVSLEKQAPTAEEVSATRTSSLNSEFAVYYSQTSRAILTPRCGHSTLEIYQFPSSS